MASIYKKVIDDVESEGSVFPYHVYSIYQIVSDTNSNEGPVDSSVSDYETQFTGSLSVGEDQTGSMGQVKSQVKKGSLSSVFGKSNDTEVERSFVYGNNASSSYVNNSFLISNGSKFDGDPAPSNFRYVRTEHITPELFFPNIKYIDFPYNSSKTGRKFGNINIELLGILKDSDGVSYATVQIFNCYYRFSDETLLEFEKEKNFEIGSVKNDVGVNINSTGIKITDDRSVIGNSNPPIRWCCYFEDSGLYSSS